MARELDYIRSEIVRVASDLSVDPRNMTRSQFIKETDVSYHDLRCYGGFSKLRSDSAYFFDVKPECDLVATRGVELRNLYNRSEERRIATADYLGNKLRDCLSDIFNKHPVVLTKSSDKLVIGSSPKERKLTLLWSDLHFGLDVDSRETLKSSYSWQIAARRMAKLCYQAAQYKRTYRKDTDLQIVLNGDIIQGVIHLDDPGIRPLAEQIYGATVILTAAIDYLKNHFSKIDVLCLPGNHDRMTYRGPERATAKRWDAHSTAIYLGLKSAFRTEPRVKFDIPMSGLGTYTAPGGSLILASHGDTEPSVGNVSKAINVDKISQNIYRMDSSKVFDKRIDVALFGHWHSPCIFMLPNGTTVIVNGCLIGGDQYGQNVAGQFNTMPSQVMFESVSGYPVGDSRIIKLRDADTESSYDKIISIPELTLGGISWQ